MNKCPFCKFSVSSEENVCPNCGKKINRSKDRKKKKEKYIGNIPNLALFYPFFAILILVNVFLSEHLSKVVLFENLDFLRDIKLSVFLFPISVFIFFMITLISRENLKKERIIPFFFALIILYILSAYVVLNFLIMFFLFVVMFFDKHKYLDPN